MKKSSATVETAERFFEWIETLINYRFHKIDVIKYGTSWRIFGFIEGLYTSHFINSDQRDELMEIWDRADGKGEPLPKDFREHRAMIRKIFKL